MGKKFWKGLWTWRKTKCRMKRITFGCETRMKQVNKPCCPNDGILNVKVGGTYTYHLIVMG